MNTNEVYFVSRWVRLTPLKKQMGSKGVYKAKVKVKDANGNYIPKTGNDGYSSFFPDAWDEEKTLQEIAYAFGNKQPIPGYTQGFLGTSTDGIPIEIWVDIKGNISTAYPFFPNTK